MTAIRVSELHCDGPDCHECFPDQGTFADVRHYAGLAGWVNKGTRDYCSHDCKVRDEVVPRTLAPLPERPDADRGPRV